MKSEVTERFWNDYKRLAPDEKELFAQFRKQFVPAAERFAADRSAGWPASLRVNDVKNAPGVWEATWSFSGPDGRATFQWIDIDGEPAILWRRVGSHAIFERVR